jgi:hypothetical protein
VAPLLNFIGPWLLDHAEVVTALATLALATVTYALVRQTRAAVEMSIRPRLADVRTGEHAGNFVLEYSYALGATVSDLAALHVAADADPFSSVHAMRSIAVRNIGSGPAIVQNVELRTWPEGEPETSGALVARTTPPGNLFVTSRAWSVPATIASGEMGRLMTQLYVEVSPTDVPQAQMDLYYICFSITAEYSDLAGRQRERMTIVVQPRHLPRSGTEHVQLPPRYERPTWYRSARRRVMNLGIDVLRMLANPSEDWNWISMSGVPGLPDRRP